MHPSSIIALAVISLIRVTLATVIPIPFTLTTLVVIALIFAVVFTLITLCALGFLFLTFPSDCMLASGVLDLFQLYCAWSIRKEIKPCTRTRPHIQSITHLYAGLSGCTCRWTPRIRFLALRVPQTIAGISTDLSLAHSSSFFTGIQPMCANT